LLKFLDGGDGGLVRGRLVRIATTLPSVVVPGDCWLEGTAGADGAERPARATLAQPRREQDRER